jgi:hypothetical protein
MAYSNTNTSKHVVHEDIIDVPFADDMAHDGFPLLKALGPCRSCAGMALLPRSLCLFGLLQLALLALSANLLRLALDVRV